MDATLSSRISAEGEWNISQGTSSTSFSYLTSVGSTASESIINEYQAVQVSRQRYQSMNVTDEDSELIEVFKRLGLNERSSYYFMGLVKEEIRKIINMKLSLK